MNELVAGVPSSARVAEAILFAADRTLRADELVELLADGDESQVVCVVAQLNQKYQRQGRPYEIRRVGQGYQMLLRPSFERVARRARAHTRLVRLSQAAVEVLSLVAYRQPVTCQQIDAIRGSDSGSILRQLRRRNLIEAFEEAEVSGRTIRYKTTKRFLDLFHLLDLNELPRVQELERSC